MKLRESLKRSTDQSSDRIDAFINEIKCGIVQAEREKREVEERRTKCMQGYEKRERERLRKEREGLFKCQESIIQLLQKEWDLVEQIRQKNGKRVVSLRQVSKTKEMNF